MPRLWGNMEIGVGHYGTWFHFAPSSGFMRILAIGNRKLLLKTIYSIHNRLPFITNDSRIRKLGCTVMAYIHRLIERCA